MYLDQNLTARTIWYKTKTVILWRVKNPSVSFLWQSNRKCLQDRKVLLGMFLRSCTWMNTKTATSWSFTLVRLWWIRFAQPLPKWCYWQAPLRIVWTHVLSLLTYILILRLNCFKSSINIKFHVSVPLWPCETNILNPSTYLLRLPIASVFSCTAFKC